MAERRHGTGRRQGTVARAVGVGAVAALVLTGCVSLPGERTVTDEEWTPATTEALTTWMGTYDEALAEGARAQDPERIQEITGNALRSSLTGEYRVAQQTGTDPAVVTHEDPEFYLPEMEDYPLRGLAVATDAETGRTVLELLDRQSARTDWRSLLSVRLDEGTQMPELATEGEHPVEPPLNEPGDLRRSPAQMARAFGGLVSATGDDSPFAVFAPHPVVDETVAQNAEYAAAQNRGAATVEHDPAEPTAVRAFETSNGGALVLAGLRDEVYLQVHSSVELPEQLATSVGSEVSAGSTVSATYTWQVALLLPPKSAAAGTEAQVLGVQRSLAEFAVGD